MAYDITKNNDNMNIDARQWGEGDAVAFTTVTSCLLLIGKKPGGGLIGVHLLMVGFDESVAELAYSLLYTCTEVQHVGSMYSWERQVGGGVERLRALLGGLNFRASGFTEDGKYAAVAVGGQIEIQHLAGA